MINPDQKPPQNAQEPPHGVKTPTKGHDSGGKKKRKTKKVSASTWAELKVAFVSGSALRELARRTGIPSGTILSRAKREGWSGQIERAKAIAPVEASPSVTHAVAESRRERGERYQERMSGVVERILPTLEKMNPMELFELSAEIDRIDKVARRNFGLDENREATQPQVNVMLLGVGLDALMSRQSERVIDVVPLG